MTSDLPGSQQVAILVQHFGKQHRLELAGRIREGDDAHLVAGAGLALLLAGDGAGQAAGGRALLHGAGEIGEGLHAHLLRAAAL